jgi:hypothetical protein
MLFGLLVAAAAATQKPAPSMADDPDLHCMVALSIALGGIDDGAIDLEDDERTGIVSLVMYYVGKIDGRLPGFDYAREVTKLVESPNYADATLVEDLDRCGEEAEQRGQTLIELGEQLKDLAPLMRGDRKG